MSKVENLEKLVQQLSPEELAEFRRWYTDFDAVVRARYDAAGHSEWLAAEIREAVEEAGANYSHDDVMTGVNAQIDLLKTEANKSAYKKRP